MEKIFCVVGLLYMVFDASVSIWALIDAKRQEKKDQEEK